MKRPEAGSVRHALLRPIWRAFRRRLPAVRCQACGAPLFHSVPFTSRGQIKVAGAGRAMVRVDFETESRLGFRHIDLGECAAAARHVHARDPH